MNMANGTFLVTGNMGWSYLKILWAYIEELSKTGMILMLAMFVIAVAASVCSKWWYPALVWKNAKKKHTNIEWIAIPNMGYYPPFILFFVVFPVFGLFTSRTDTWWIFLIEGWLAALLIILYVRVMRKMTLAIMKADGKFYLSRRCGLFGWNAANELIDLKVSKEKYLGYNSYGLYYEKDGYTKKYGYLSDANFPASYLPELREFIREYKEI